MSKKLLLLDTNIISHALTPSQTNAYVELFKRLEVDYRFVVTGFTKYELMRSSDKEHRDKIATYLEQDMSLVELSDVLMGFAARVHFLYSKHVSTKNLKITDGDIVNAAFSIAKESAIMTIDNNDHPTPFFKETGRYRITYNSRKGKETTDTAYVLYPDMVNIKECFERCRV